MERAKAMAIESSEIAAATAAGQGFSPRRHALRACPDRAQSHTGGLQTHGDLRPGCLQGLVMVTVGERGSTGRAPSGGSPSGGAPGAAGGGTGEGAPYLHGRRICTLK